MSVGVPVQCENLLAWGKEERKFAPPGTKHGASTWSQDWKTVRHFSVRGCTMLSGSRRGQGAKCQGNQSDRPTGYLGVTCRELCILRHSAKGFSRTVQLNPLASRETSSAQRQIMYCFAFSRSFDSGRLCGVWLSFHITFAASKCYHPDDISVTENVNICRIQAKRAEQRAFRSPGLNTRRNQDRQAH
jgi:hypothetical protein